MFPRLSLAFFVVLIVSGIFAGDAKFTVRDQVEEKHWALLVAGSNSWYNYRHQADICHAYQVLSSHGIPDENIVVMMYDDLAQNKRNPTPGIIINKPHGKDVYHGVPKDYTEKDVTPKNFLEILKGNKKHMRNIGSGKVIDSGPNDHVFVYFSDHGAPGLIAFPGLDNMLYAHQLNKAIKYMHQHKKYKKMVFYIESCESGSMFRKLLPGDIKVYATTASNYNESSYACYYDRKYETYLGDYYSVNWMENSDKAVFDVETLLQQFKLVKQETNMSHVQKYGDMSFDDDKLDEYQGEEERQPLSGGELQPSVPFDAVPAPDVAIEILRHRLVDAESEKEKEEIRKELNSRLKMREKIKATMEEIAGRVTGSEKQKNYVLSKSAEPRNYDCYEKAVTRFSRSCFGLNEHEYALRHLYVLSNLCEERIATKRILDGITGVCGKSRINLMRKN